LGSPPANYRLEVVTAPLPPRTATWLLERLGSHSRAEPLLGDLAEEFAGGRTRFWYWRQTLGALGLDLLRALRTHTLSFIAAVLTGCVLTSLWVRASAYAFQPIYRNLPYVGRHPWSGEALLRVAGMQLNGISSVALTFATVWLVIHVHSAHRRAVLAVFVAVLTAPRLPAITRLLVDAAIHSHFAAALAPVLMPAALQAVITLAVGLWTIRAERFAAMNRWTRSVAIFAIAQAILVALLYRARLVGLLPFSRPEWTVLDASDVAVIAYLALLLWGPNRPAFTKTATARGRARDHSVPEA
jgi:hypothetical protein